MEKAQRSRQPAPRAKKKDQDQGRIARQGKARREYDIGKQRILEEQRRKGNQTGGSIMRKIGKSKDDPGKTQKRQRIREAEKQRKQEEETKENNRLEDMRGEIDRAQKN